MDRKLLIVSFFAIFGSYLIFSIPFAHAFFLGDVVNPEKKISLAPLTPGMRILIGDSFGNEFEPFDCQTEGYLEFVLVPENIDPNSYVTANETYIHDSQMPGTSYDISSALSCFPTTDLISSQEISCKINLEYLISKLPYCPLGRSENTIEVRLDFMSDQGGRSLSASKDIVITDIGLEPAIKIVPEHTPEGRLQDINCKTGSILEVPVSVTHAEVFGEDLEWTFYVNSTNEYDTLDCALAYENWPLNNLKEEIYYCEVFVYNSTIPYCTPGESVTFGMKARSGDYEMDHNTTVLLYSQDLNLGLSLTGVPSNVECQAVDLEGMCYPETPQRQFRFHINNAPKKLDVYKFSADFEGKSSDVLCDKVSGEDYIYECDFVLGSVDLDGDDPEDPINFQGTFPFGLTVETRFLNTYYRTLRASSEVSYYGSLPSDIVDRKKQLEKLKDQIKKYKEDYNLYSTIISWVTKLLCCCAVAGILTDILTEPAEEGAEEAIKKGIGEVFLEFVKQMTGMSLFMKVLMDFGVSSLECILNAEVKLLERTTDKLDEFEQSPDPEGIDMNVPCMEKDKTLFEQVDCVIMEDGGWWGAGGCALKGTARKLLDSLTCGIVGCFEKIITGSFEEKIECSAYIWACLVIIAALTINPSPLLTKICKYTKIGLEYASLALAFLFMFVSTLNMKHQMGLTMAQIETQLKIQSDMDSAMQDWADAMTKFTDEIKQDTEALALLHTIFDPPSASLFFRSVGGQLIEYNETYCYGEKLSMEYDFAKLNVTADFASEVGIYNSGRNVRTLRLPGINGTYGPQKINIIVGTGGNGPTGEYDFVMDYGYGRASYKLYYLNYTCM